MVNGTAAGLQFNIVKYVAEFIPRRVQDLRGPGNHIGAYPVTGNQGNRIIHRFLLN
jgi:hypothetical protein